MNRTSVTADPATTSAQAARLRRARAAVWCYFMLAGVVLATWSARIPAVKAGLGLSDGALSLGLLAVGAGALVSMQAVGPIIDRYGSAAAMVPSGGLLGVGIIGPGLADGPAELIGALFFIGACYGWLDVAMNAHAVQVERAYRRPIMASFHAVYSLGGLAGALYGSVLARAGVSPAVTFAAIGVPMAVLVVVAGRWLLPPEARPQPAGAREAGRQRRWAGPVLLLGMLGLFCFLDEGSAADWSSVYLHDSLHSSAALAPLAYGTFSITMALGRLAGDRIVARFGRVRVVRYGAGLAAAGLGAGLLASMPVAGIAGFGVLGAGLSCIVPQLFTAAGNLDPRRAGHLVAQVSSLSYLGILIGPVAIGAIATVVGLPLALGLPVLLALVVALSAGAVRPRAFMTAGGHDHDPSG
jgi:MFS family permease